MPAQTAKSGLTAKLGERMRKAHEAHKNDETVYGIVNLPPGIAGGVAQLKKAYWAEYGADTKLAGLPYVRLEGRAVLPEYHNGVPVRGMMVSLMLPLCDQKDKQKPKTFEQNYADLLNELRKFGVETAKVRPDDIETILAALTKQQPFYLFSTRGWTPPPTAENPRPDLMVFTQFDGKCEPVKPEAGAGVKAGPARPAAGTDKASPAAPADEVAAVARRPAPAAAGNGAGRKPGPATRTAKAPEPEPETQEAFDEFGDIDSLVAAATEGDDAAQDRLREMATAAGVADEDVDAAADWDAVKELILAGAPAGGEGEGEGGEESDEWHPQMSDIYLFQPRDPVTKKPAVDKKSKKPLLVEGEVTAIDREKRTVTMMRLDDKKETHGVPYPDGLHEATATA